jgi:hypothetical protein
MIRTVSCCFWLCLLGHLFAPLATALELGIGPRLGLSRSPNGIELGAQVLISDFGIDLIEPLRLETSVDWGFGKTESELGERISFSAVQLNLNLQYLFWSPTRVLHVYPLLGFGWHRFKLEGVTTESRGINLGGGVQYHGLGAHFSFGLGDLPQLTLTSSYTIRF